MTRVPTDAQLERLAAFIARITLEIERDLRQPELLRAVMSPQAWNLWQQSRIPGRFHGGAIVDADIGTPRVQRLYAGGGGIETALVAAADAGDGWAFAKLRHALHRAQRINEPLWTAFDELGGELGVNELRDLASSIGLAGAQGARIRASLAVKADTLRSHQIAETEAAAEATTERMNLPTAVLLLGFLIFIVFPAVTAITGVNTGSCMPGDPDCETYVTTVP